jgi:hypothetical protein
MSLGFGDLREIEKEIGYFEKQDTETSLCRFTQFNLPDKNTFVPSIKNTEVTRTPDEIVIKNLITKYPEICKNYSDIIQTIIKEPKPTPEKAKYGLIIARQTHSGHVFIQDDTPGNRRVITQHATGTYDAMLNDGSQVIHVTKDRMLLVKENQKIYIGEDSLILIDGNEWVEIKKNRTEHIDNDKYSVIDHNKKTKIKNDEEREIGNNSDLKIQANYTVTVNGNITIKSQGITKINASQILLNC